MHFINFLKASIDALNLSYNQVKLWYFNILFFKKKIFLQIYKKNDLFLFTNFYIYKKVF